MTQPQPNAVLEYIRGQLVEANAASLSDRELLRRFANQQDEIAFKVLLRRHGPMVLRACQRVLDRAEDAEDVFQATFLVLARKAGVLNWRESIGTWLYEVAHRLAKEARRKQLRQQAREAQAKPPTAKDPLAEISGRELVAILDEEMANLPERYRAPLLLCCLEGKSGDKAAQQLHCSPSTLQRRLRQARELLQSQLHRRGFALSAAAVSALLLANTGSAEVPAALTAGLVRASVLVAEGKPLAAGLVSAKAVTLAGSMTPAMVVTKLKVAFALVLVVGLVAGAYSAARQNLTAVVAESSGQIANESQLEGTEEAQANPSDDDAGDLLAVEFPPEPWLGPPVAATVETTLTTGAGQIRQFAFDGDADSFFASAHNPERTDHFTLVFDRPVIVKSIVVGTGRPDGGDRLDAGTLELSADAKAFRPMARFVDGVARAESKGRIVQAIRVTPGTDLDHPLTIREFAIESYPPVAAFKYPVEFIVDVTDAPEMKEWAEKAARICERAYPMINEELKSDDFKPRPVITIALKNDYTANAAMGSGGHITGSVKHFKANPDNVGALVHITARLVQAHKGKNNPPWLSQGIADYVRFFKYEPGKLGPIDPELVRYDGGYRMTAAFLAYLTEQYDPDIVRKLNQLMREGQYTEEAFEELTGKTIQELDEEWRAFRQ